MKLEETLRGFLTRNNAKCSGKRKFSFLFKFCECFFLANMNLSIILITIIIFSLHSVFDDVSFTLKCISFEFLPFNFCACDTKTRYQRNNCIIYLRLRYA